MQGCAVDEYRAPLFLAWQLTNRCAARCITCCEEAGPDKAWRDEISRDEALDVARRVAEFGIPYVAFGAGEPLSMPHYWPLLASRSSSKATALLAAAGVALER